MKKMFLTMGLMLATMGAMAVEPVNATVNDGGRENATEVNTPVRESKFVKGVEWQVYKANGTTVAASIQKERNYGKYYTINVSITNTGDKAFTFDPSTTAAYGMKKGREITMEVLTADQYMKKVKRSQGWDKFWNTTYELTEAADAGTTTYHETSHTRMGHTRVATHTDGIVHDRAAEYWATQNAFDRIDKYNAECNETRMELSENYLRKNTIEPGEVMNGYMNVKYDKVQSMDYVITVNGVPYTFTLSE